jgi:protein TonB
MPPTPAGAWPRPGRDDETSPAERRALTVAVALAHLVAAWALLQLDPVRDAVRGVAPLVVDLIAPPKPEPPPPAPAPAPRPQVTRQPQPLQPVIAAPPAPAPETFTVPAPPPEPAPPEPSAVPLAIPTPVIVAPAPAAAPPARKVVPPTAVQYLVLPPVEVPRLSRRAGESGTVWLRVLVDRRGQPSQVSVQRSSGHARLDEQALWAMRQARFKPYTENGQPFEIEVTAPIEYSLE